MRHSPFQGPEKPRGFWVGLSFGYYFDAEGLAVTDPLGCTVTDGLTLTDGTGTDGLLFTVGFSVGFTVTDGSTFVVGEVPGRLLLRVQPANTATNTTINMINMISFFIQFASFILFSHVRCKIFLNSVPFASTKHKQENTFRPCYLLFLIFCVLSKNIF